jgi:hypothetical protein
MNKFEYTPASKFMCRYAIAPLNLILLMALIVQVMNIGSQPLSIIIVIVCAAILFMANIHFYRSYSILPFLIVADHEKLTASNFMRGKETIKIKYSDIDSVSGGVFGYNRKGLIFLHDGVQNISICIHPTIINVDGLVRIIIDNVNSDLRDEMITRLKRWEEK